MRAGFDVVAADLFADEDLASRCPAEKVDDYPAGLADWLISQDVDAWLYTGALENYPDLVDRMAEIRPLWGNQGTALRQCRDPFELQQALQATSFSLPDTRRSADGLPRDGSWLCKACDGAGGSGVWALEDEAAVARAYETDAAFQRYVFGTPASAAYASDGLSCQLLGITEQLVGAWQLHAPRWAYCGSLFRRDLWTHYSESLQHVGEVLSRYFKLRGVFGIDLVLAGEQDCILEVNPRYTASMEVVESHKDTSAIAEHARCFGTEASSVGTRPIVGKAVLYARQQATISPSFTALLLDSARAGRVADIPVAESVIMKGQPVLSVLGRSAASSSPEADPYWTRASLFRASGSIESRLYAGQ